MITVIYGPPGSEKTQNSSFLKGKYAAKRIIDEWPYTNIKPKEGDLILTTDPKSAPPNSKLIHIADALRS